MTPRVKWFLLLLFFAAVLLALLGIPLLIRPARQDQGEAVLFTFPWWGAASEIAGCVLALGLWWWFRKGLAMKLQLVLLVLGIGLPMMQLPTLLVGRVLVDDDHFESRDWSGISVTELNVHFERLREIRQVESVSKGSAAHTTELVLVPRSGEPMHFDTKPVLREAAAQEIVDRAAHRRLPPRIEIDRTTGK